jgi:hypothetical protein
VKSKYLAFFVVERVVVALLEFRPAHHRLARKLGTSLAARKQFLQTSRAVNIRTSTTLRRSTQPVMLRASLRSSRAFGYKSNVINAGRQWHAVQTGRVVSGSLVGALKNFNALN